MFRIVGGRGRGLLVFAADDLADTLILDLEKEPLGVVIVKIVAYDNRFRSLSFIILPRPRHRRSSSSAISSCNSPSVSGIPRKSFVVCHTTLMTGSQNQRANAIATYPKYWGTKRYKTASQNREKSVSCGMNSNQFKSQT